MSIDLLQKYSLSSSYEPANTLKTVIGRLYLYNGQWVPSVTSILEHSKPLEQKVFLQNFRANNEQYVTHAVSGGIVLHKLIEEYLLAQTLPDEQELKELQQLGVISPEADLCKAFSKVKPLLEELEPLHLEKSLVNLQEGYAGTVDFVGYYKGVLYVFDWKSSLQYKPKINWGSYPKQLAAYINSANLLLDLDIQEGKVIKIYQDGVHDMQVYNLTKEKYPKALEGFNHSKGNYYSLLKYLLKTGQL